MATWRENFEDYFPYVVRQRGQEYFQQRRVQLRKRNGLSFHARVEGSAVYAVKIARGANPERDWHLDCHCPHYTSGNFCKHLWAVLLELERQVPGWISNAPRDLQVYRGAGEDDGAVEWRELFRSNSDLVEPRLPRLERDLCFGLNLDGLRQSPEKIEIYCFERRARKSGGWTQVKPARLGWEDLQNFPWKIEDRQLLQILFAGIPLESYQSYSYASFSRVRLLPQNCLQVLPQLCASGKFFYFAGRDPASVKQFTPLQWLGTCRHELRWESRADAWALQAVLQGEAGELPIAETVCVSPSGIVVLPEGLAWLHPVPSQAWLRHFQRHRELRVSQRERQKFCEALFACPWIETRDLPEELQVSSKASLPVPLLYLSTPAERPQVGLDLLAEPRFRYGRNGFFSDQGEEKSFLQDEDGSYLKRHPEQERHFLESLESLGLRRIVSYTARSSSSALYLNSKTLPELLQALKPLGWELYLEKAPLKTFSTYRLSVHTTPDWFELQVAVDGVEFPLPTLLTALRQKRNFVKLKDGSTALIPEAWRDELSPFAQIGTFSETGLRYGRSQGLLIAHLLRARQQQGWDLDFDELLRRLKDAENLAPCEPPSGLQGTLRPYQKEGLAWLKFLQRAGFGGCLADDMGLGKTVQVLSLLEQRRTERVKDRKPSLVVVPRSLIHNWLEEAARFTPRLKVLDYSGKERRDYQGQLAKQHLVLTTYGTLRRDIAELSPRLWDYVVLDESQAIKNAGAQVAKAVKCLDAQHRLALSGTPVENHLGDLFSLFDFLNPGLLGSQSGFQSLLRNKDPDPELLKALAQGLKPFILRRSKTQVLKELPKKTEQTLHCELQGEQRRLYDELKNYYRQFLSQKIESTGLAKNKILVLEALLRLRQAACHPGLVNPKHHALPSAKLESLLEQVREITQEGHKALIFSQFTTFLALLQKRLKQESLNYEYLDGKTRDRPARVRRFQQDPDCPLFLISLKAGGFGLNLTTADYVFVLDPWWNPAVEAQAIDRTHRLGQSKPVFAYRLIAKDTVEEKILELQKRKKVLAESIVAESASLISKIDAEDLRFLLG